MNPASTEFIRGLHNLRPRHRGCVATIGSFDGVHLGHRAILRQVKEAADKYGLPATVIVFEPQPHEFFSGEKAPPRLMSLREKFIALAEAGADRVLCVKFDRALQRLSAREFIDAVLVRGLGIHHLVVGDDFRFGCDRAGDFALLQRVGREQGFGVSDTCTLTHEGARISSTRIRAALEAGQFELAEALLGRPYRIGGRVVYGRQLGRELGVPTANIHLRRYRSPLQGVFAVTAELADGSRHRAVANVGVRPTLSGDAKPLLEVHLLDFHGSLYGQRLSAEFHERLRSEHKFASLDELRAQLQRDIARAQRYFDRQSRV